MLQLSNGTSRFQFKSDLKEVARVEAQAAHRPTTYVTFKIKGEKTTACKVAGQIDVPPGRAREIAAENLSWVQREVGYDAPGCAADLEGAWVTASGAIAAGFRLDPGDVSESSASAAQRLGADRPAATLAYSWDGRIKGYVEEPAQADVSSSTARMQWSGSTCALSTLATSYWGWFTPTGWTDVERWSSNGSTSSPCSINRSTFGKYKNGVFCFTNDTWSQEYVTFKARPSGASAASWDVTKWGGCSWLLTTHHYYDPN